MRNEFAGVLSQKGRKKAAKEVAKLNKISLDVSNQGQEITRYVPRYISVERPTKQHKAYRRPVVAVGLELLGRGIVEVVMFAGPLLIKAVYWMAYGACLVVYYLALGIFDVLKEIAQMSTSRPGRQVYKDVDQVDKCRHVDVYQSIHIGDKAKNVTINQQNRM